MPVKRARLPLPLTLGGVEIANESLQGYNYTAGAPLALQALLLHAIGQLDAYTVENTVIYCGPGKQRLYTQKGLGWLTGTKLLACTKDYFDSPIYIMLLVHSYDDSTGALFVENIYQNIFIPNLKAQWLLTTRFPAALLSAPLAIASGGTGASDVRTARSNLTLGRMESYKAPLFDDFIGDGNATITNRDSSNVITNVARGQTATPVSANAPGLGALSTDVTNLQQRCSFGGYVTDNNETSYYLGTKDFTDEHIESIFEARIYLPAVSSGITSRFKVEVGLLSEFGVSTGENGTHCKVTYTDTENGGRWQSSYKTVSGGVVTADTGNLVMGSVYYRIKFYWSGTDLKMSMDGIEMFSLAGGIDGNPCPAVDITYLSGGGGPCKVYIDYIYLKQQVTR